MLQPERICEIYNSILLHFKENSSYNAKKYNFRVKNRKIPQGQLWYYQRIAKFCKSEEQTVLLFLANLLKNNNRLPHISQIKKQHFENWAIEFSNAPKVFKNDLLYLKKNKSKSFDELFVLDDSQLCSLIKAALCEEINMNTVIILDLLLDFSKNCLNKINKSDLFAKEHYIKIHKVSQIMTISSNRKKEYKKIILETY